MIGRRKADSTELDPRPVTSHVARTDQDEVGKILRRNIAYGSVTRHGTIFVGFSATQRVLADMLDRMVGRDGGPMDELTAFTFPRTGAYYFVPSSDHLAALGGPAGRPRIRADARRSSDGPDGARGGGCGRRRRDA